MISLVEGTCPKCGRIGTQEIYQMGGRHDPRALYMRYNHKTAPKRCYIGRVKSTTEAMGKFEEPTVEQLKQTLDGIIKDVRKLVNSYPKRSKGIRQKALANRLNEILATYGY